MEEHGCAGAQSPRTGLVVAAVGLKNSDGASALNRNPEGDRLAGRRPGRRSS